MSAEKSAKKSYFKVVLGGFLGLCTGAIAMYFNAIFNQVVRPAKPVANFSLGQTEGLTATFRNMASGHSGWWDFGDGSPMEPFESNTEQLQHTFPKPGSYKVSLTVRNFLMEETDRSVSVDLAGTAATPNTLPPSILGWKVEPIDTKVPATFRVTGEIQNADELVWRVGDNKTEHLTAQPGPFEKFITVRNPGDHPIVLTAMSKSKVAPQVMVTNVTALPRKEPTYEAMLTVRDSAVRMDKPTLQQTFPAPIRDAKGAATKGFTREIKASPNSKIVSVELDKTAKPSVRRDRFRVEIAKDRSGAIVTGEWGTSGDALARETGGTDMLVPLTIVEERYTALSPTISQPSGVMNMQTGTIQIKLPPQPTAGVQREIILDFGELYPDPDPKKPNVMKRDSLARAPLDPKGTWTGKANLHGTACNVTATTANGVVTIKVTR
jgi:hypothetical protein